ncbi:RNF31 (predicted) [Pycnogonum litorale]
MSFHKQQSDGIINTGKIKDGRHCDLCGCSSPVVRCDRCDSQIFCLSCDDVYHRHPRRHAHNRKALDTMLKTKPPTRPTETESQNRPVAPPRKKRFDSFRNKAPGLPKKELSWSERLNSLKRFMGARPLPSTPSDQHMATRMNALSMYPGVQEELPPLPVRNPPMRARDETRACIPVPVQELAMEQSMARSTLHRSASLRNPADTGTLRSRCSSGGGGGGMTSIDSWDHLQGHVMHPGYHHFYPQSAGINQSVSVADLQTYDEDVRFHHHHHPDLGLAPAQSMSHLRCGPCGPMQPFWYNPHMMHQCGGCQHHVSNISGSLHSVQGYDGSSSADGAISGRETPVSKERAPRSVASNQSRRNRILREREKTVKEDVRKKPMPSPDQTSEDQDYKDDETSETGSSGDYDATYQNEESTRAQTEGPAELCLFDKEWQCQHCTYINEPKTRICAVCCKTSENPRLLEDSSRSDGKTTRRRPVDVQSAKQRQSQTLNRERRRKTGSEGKWNTLKGDRPEVKSSNGGKPHRASRDGSNLTADSDFEYRSFPVPQESVPTEDTPPTEPLYMNEKEVDDARKDFLSGHGEPELCIYTNEPSKNPDENRTGDGAPPPRPTDAKPGLFVNLPPPPPSFEDSELGGKGQVPSPLVRRKDKPRLQTPPETRRNASTTPICSKPRVPSDNDFPRVRTPPTLDTAELLKAQQEAERAILKQLQQKGELLQNQNRIAMLQRKIAPSSDAVSYNRNEPKSPASSRNSFSSTASRLPQSNATVPLEPLNVDLNFARDGRRPNGIGVTSPLSDATEDFQSTCTSPTQQFRNVVGPINYPAQVNQGLLKVAPAPVEYVQQAPVQSNRWPQERSVIKPPSSSQWSNANVAVVNNDRWTDSGSRNFQQHYAEPDYHAALPNIWAPEIDDRSFVNPALQDRMWRKTSSDIHEPIDRSNRRSSQPMVIGNYNNSLDVPWNRELAPDTSSLRRTLSQTSLTRTAGGMPSSMGRSASRTSLMGDDPHAGHFNGTERPYRQRNVYADDEPSPRWAPTGRFGTLPRSYIQDHRGYEAEEDTNLRRRNYYLSMEELVHRRKRNDLRHQGFELVNLLREAEVSNFTAEDLQVAINHCGSKQNPIQWLKDNWKNMVETVVTLATNYGHDKRDNDVGIISNEEARDALRAHLGNVWAAVTQCVESRQKKVMELTIRGGDFNKHEIVVALSSNQGNVEAAYDELAKVVRPFRMDLRPVDNDGIAKKNDSDEDYKLAPENFSVFSSPVDLRNLDIGNRKSEDGRKDEVVRKDRSDEKIGATADDEDETVIQWLIRDSYRPRVQVDVDEKKKLKSVEMIRAAMDNYKQTGSRITAKEDISDDKKRMSPPKKKKSEEDRERQKVPNDKKKLAQERKVRMFLAEGKCDTFEQAEVASKLVDMMFEEDESVEAAKECGDVYLALNYLRQECELCAAQYPAAEMISMVHCTHRACQNCTKTYFTLQIRDRHIMDAKCPFCDEPDLGDEDIAQDYFNHLDRMLKTVLEVETYELFQRKLRDKVLTNDPNFKWCSKCSSGFIAERNKKKLVCPDCHAVMCGQCLVQWEDQHQGITCEAFKEWKESNDPQNQAAGVNKHLEEHGIQCPKCKFKFSLSRGGCMHYKCTQCQYEFCSGCGKPFKMGAKCGKATICAKLGLHAHHPRNCLFYLRDKDPEDLQKLLTEMKIDFKTEIDDDDVKNCMVMEQKEIEDGFKDEPCNKEVELDYAGYCRNHYIEYLGGLITQHKIDPIVLLNEDELELILRRAEVRLPLKPWREKPDQYRQKLIRRIEDTLPLEKEIAA